MAMDRIPAHKRPRTNRASSSRHDTTFHDLPQAAEELDYVEDDAWLNSSLFAIDAPIGTPLEESYQLNGYFDAEGEEEDTKGNSASSMNAWDNVTQDQDILLMEVLPEAFPAIPPLESRIPFPKLLNCFEQDLHSFMRHFNLRPASVIPEDGAVNGYIKFRLRMCDIEGEPQNKAKKTLLGAKRKREERYLHRESSRSVVHTRPRPSQKIGHLPSNYGISLKLDPTDRRLFKFYQVAYCQGRTLLSGTNFWIKDVAAMAAGDECVSHAVLALAGAYVLDYLPSAKLLERTNDHYQKAVSLVSSSLACPETFKIGEGDSVISAILILLVDDCINWELRKPKGEVPNWFCGGQLAKAILDQTDPGYRYWKAENIQCSNARLANANWAAFACILGQLVSPVDLEDQNQTFSWLLSGSERDVHKIHGSTGLCPKLLHTLGQVTHLTARLRRNPDSSIFPKGAARLESRLLNFRQWSEFSEGYEGPIPLLASCQLDKTGKVHTATKVTELTGETWVSATQIYLHCRFYRRPRSHPLVQASLNILLRCIEIMPYDGVLFTSQAPFCPIVISALVATTEIDRKTITDWFTAVVTGASCRSSVPPVWRAVQSMWEWMDENLTEEYNEELPIGKRKAWWEDMVDELIEREGYISLT